MTIYASFLFKLYTKENEEHGCWGQAGSLQVDLLIRLIISLLFVKTEHLNTDEYNLIE